MAKTHSSLPFNTHVWLISRRVFVGGFSQPQFNSLYWGERFFCDTRPCVHIRIYTSEFPKWPKVGKMRRQDSSKVISTRVDDGSMGQFGTWIFVPCTCLSHPSISSKLGEMATLTTDHHSVYLDRVPLKTHSPSLAT